MERLTFVKSLHREGVEQSHRTMPLASMSVLTFHDAIELFLYTGAEVVDTKPDTNILDTFNNIEQKIDEELFGQGGIKRLREARAGLKHFANRPDEREIESFRSTTQSFFEENSPKIFDINYSDIKLARLVKFEGAKEHLLRGGEYWEQSKEKKAMGELTLAHQKLMTEHRDRSRWDLSYTPYPRFSLKRTSDIEELEDINETFRAVADAIMYVSLGFDYSRYSRFEHLTPSLVPNPRSDNDYQKYMPRLDTYDYSEKPEGTYEYCQNFLVELALSLQNSDFDFENEPESPSNSAFDW